LFTSTESQHVAVVRLSGFQNILLLRTLQTHRDILVKSHVQHTFLNWALIHHSLQSQQLLPRNSTVLPEECKLAKELLGKMACSGTGFATDNAPSLPTMRNYFLQKVLTSYAFNDHYGPDMKQLVSWLVPPNYVSFTWTLGYTIGIGTVWSMARSILALRFTTPYTQLPLLTFRTKRRLVASAILRSVIAGGLLHCWFGLAAQPSMQHVHHHMHQLGVPMPIQLTAQAALHLGVCSLLMNHKSFWIAPLFLAHTKTAHDRGFSIGFMTDKTTMPTQQK
jgi:hypothetical protein